MLDQLDDPIPFVVSDELLARARARGTKLRRRRRGGRALAVVPVLVVLALVAGAAWVDHRTDQVDRVSIAAGLLTPVAAGQPYNVLVVGTDAQPGVDGQRSDTQMIVRVDPAGGKLGVLSLPRDLVLPGDTERINAKFGEGGPDALIAAIHDGLGIPISHYVAIDFTGFARLVDAAGGVSVQAQMEFRDDHTGLHLSPGCQHLDGAAALALVRSRYLERRAGDTQPWVTEASGDLSRVNTQQVVVGLVLRQLQARAGDPATLDSLLNVFADNTTVDAGFSRTDILALARWGEGIDPGTIETQTLPVRPTVLSNGGDVLVPTSDATKVIDGFDQGQTAPTTADPAGGGLISACS